MDLIIYLALNLVIFFVLLGFLIKYKNVVFLLILIVYVIIFWSTISFMFLGLDFFFGQVMGLVSYKQGCKDLYNSFFNVKVLGNIHRDNCIYVANYPNTQIGYAMIGYLGDFTILGRAFKQVGIQAKLSQIVYNSSNYIEVNKDGGSYESVKNNISKHIKTKPILGYVEDMKLRTNIYTLTTLRQGLFKIAKELNINVVPIVFDHIKYDKYGRITDRNLKIFIGDQYQPSKYKTVDELIFSVSTWMQDKLNLCASS